MITVTEQLKNVFEANPLYSKEGQGLNAEVIARFFLPFSSVVWLVTEAEQQEDGDWLFFGTKGEDRNSFVSIHRNKFAVQKQRLSDGAMKKRTLGEAENKEKGSTEIKEE